MCLLRKIIYVFMCACIYRCMCKEMYWWRLWVPKSVCASRGKSIDNRMKSRLHWLKGLLLRLRRLRHLYSKGVIISEGVVPCYLHAACLRMAGRVCAWCCKKLKVLGYGASNQKCFGRLDAVFNTVPWRDERRLLSSFRTEPWTWMAELVPDDLVTTNECFTRNVESFDSTFAVLSDRHVYLCCW